MKAEAEVESQSRILKAEKQKLIFIKEKTKAKIESRSRKFKAIKSFLYRFAKQIWKK